MTRSTPPQTAQGGPPAGYNRSAALLPHGAPPALLWRQWCLLAVLAGLAAGETGLRDAAPAWGAAVLGFMVLWSGRQNAGRPTAVLRALVLGVCMAAGVCFMLLHRQPAAEVPGWMTAQEKVRVQGVVRIVESRPEGRLRMVLADARCRTAQGWQTLKADVVWTWQYPVFRPRSGSTVEFEGRVKPVRGFLNRGTWDSGSFWLRNGVGYRVWTRAEQGQVHEVPAGKPAAESALFRGDALQSAEVMRGLRSLVLQRVERVLAGMSDPIPADADGQGALRQMPRWRDLPQRYAVLPALLLGERFYLSQQTMDRLADAGLMHSFALSGMHLGLAAALGALAALLAGRIFPGLYLVVPRQQLAVLCAAPPVLGYVWLGGATPSLLRAALMFAFWGGLLLAGRRGVLTDGLLWAVAVVVAWQPQALFDLRLQLSAVAVAGIACAMPVYRAAAGRLGTKHGTAAGAVMRLTGGLAGVLAVSMAAQLALMPLTLDAFGSVTPWFVLNALWLPALGLWVLPLAFAGLLSLALPQAAPVAVWLFHVATVPVEWLLEMLGTLEAGGLLYPVLSVRPLPCAAAGFWMLLGTACLLWRGTAGPVVQQSGRSVLLPYGLRAVCVTVTAGVVLLAAPVCLRFSAYLQDDVSVSVLDVGQGQAVLVEAPHGVRVLIDGGGFPSSSFDTGKALVAPVLTYNRPPVLSAVVNTHPDSDHLGGLPFILQSFDVGAFYTNGELPQEGAHAAALERAWRAGAPVPAVLAAGDSLLLGSTAELQVLAPEAGRMTGNTNDNSLILRLTRGGRGLALVPADAGTVVLDRLAQAARRQNIPVEAALLVVPHHGSGNSLSPLLYDAVAPSLAVASCGYMNYWRFPRPEVRGALEARGIPLLTTSGSGQITVCWPDSGHMQVRSVR
ncbi:ComEC/Rec2 family competence protein [Oleidesulfovibrio alaskensis]|uniref:ComEC/Rec2 family competence protein n=1 Tax=Oleidesulfovibrio alaskensis TaxID=58180 RepID=UPI001A527458|nr:ComEC/Rec2 family competence protein [Oleidesulfovibrio alaskensis]MBL3583121.1 ComEC/Rec2 family competence protein [Oleidesulfovibrio alaskensis]